jgi:large subunit ribosomal protein L29
MKASKAENLRECSVPELEVKLRDAKENQFKLRLRKETRQLEDMVSVRIVRREVARIETILKQKKTPTANTVAAK